MVPPTSGSAVSLNRLETTPSAAALATAPVGTAPLAKSATNGAVPSISGSVAKVHASSGFPPLSALGRLGQVRLHDAPTQMVDGDLATGTTCLGRARDCVVTFRLAKPAKVEVIRLSVGPKGSNALDANQAQVGTASVDMGSAVATNDVRIQLRASNVTRTFDATTSEDFIHWNEALLLPAGEVTVTIEWRGESQPQVPFIYELSLFASSGDILPTAWNPTAMVIRAGGPFYRNGPDFSTLSTLAFAEELRTDLSTIRRFAASEVIDVGGTAYALVRRDGVVTCPGAYHSYKQTYLVLERRTGLLAAWQDTETASLFKRGHQVRSRAYSVASGDETVLELSLSARGVTSSKVVATPSSPLLTETAAADGWQGLPREFERECRPVSKAEGAAYASVTPAAATVELGRSIASCPLRGGGRLLIYTDTCWEEISAVVAWVDGKARRLSETDGASSLQLRRAPNGQWLLSVWRDDRGHIYRIEPNGKASLLFEHAAFGTRQVESCRCSA